jgi:hypothetical protein
MFPLSAQPIELVPHYRAEAERVRTLASLAIIPGVRDVLLGMVRQYEDLADKADLGPLHATGPSARTSFP